MEDINNVANKIITDKRYRKELYKEYIKSSEDIFYDSFNGIMKSEVLYLFMENSFHNRMMQILLDQILRYCDVCCIDTSFFNRLSRFPKIMIKNYVITLSHLPLSFVQLYKLNMIYSTMEAFCQLIYIICKYDSFTPVDMELFLNDNKMHRTVIEYCIISVEKELGTSDKIVVAKKHYNS